MAREIPHRYLQDNDGAEYFPVTSGKAIEELDKAASIVAINEKIVEINDKMKLMDLTLGDMVGDTGWIDYQVSTTNTKNYISSAPPCAIREVRVGNDLNGKWFVVRSIRLNIGKINHDQIIAQLPQGFTNEAVSFVLRSNGNKTPIEISIEKDATVKAYLNGSDSDLWACGEYTWLV
ncbi:hypothetical protein I6J04_01555 [Staphylococcus carnosus]|uniref:Uncharacterized protein n=1 Tax=Staphylococcus carnosus TaxID=1281 RepID=A0AAJ0NIE8_STACA|nr:hypothetical protein [Staphylococcus carnosus]KKB26549.1 hypothetical protein VV61_03415 [Staphylococcus carnosus]QQS85507.1 hypothetical protein I6J04_01555 [Staphylococcus carnosus]UTC00798.1 hypothetical protein A7E59_08545 [Staphylococcus carnosus]UTC02414.1 hypothetical protein A2I68_04245 [Staphylococcus carnosus]